MPPNVILQYYEGILQQLRSEVDSINSAFKHQGVKGAGNEAVLRNLLETFLPKKYGVGTGVVIDKDGNQSRQSDIVIYDNVLYPSLLALGKVHLFPVDIVYATIEVKTTLDAKSAREALENIASVRSLKLVPGDFATPFTHPESSGGTGWSLVVAKPTPPLGFVFAYNSSTPQLETFMQWFAPTQSTQIVGPPGAPMLCSPSVVGCLDQGLLLFTGPNDAVSPQPTPNLDFSGWALNLWENGEPLEISGTEREITHEGRVYPVRRTRQISYAVDQARVLLAFMLFLNEFLPHKLINPAISFIDSYLVGTTPLLRRSGLKLVTPKPTT